MDNQKQLPKTMGNSWLLRLIKLYNILYWKKYAVTHRPSIATVGSRFKPVYEEHGEMILALCIILHFEWKGANDTDMKQHQNLADNNFPLLWVPSQMSKYVPFLRDFAGVDLISDKEVYDMFLYKIEQLDLTL